MTHVVTIGSQLWPACERPDGSLLVDLRLFKPYPELAWAPEKLPKDFPADVIALAATSDPPGFICIPKEQRAAPPA